jgi:hypothetical protein
MNPMERGLAITCFALCHCGRACHGDEHPTDPAPPHAVTSTTVDATPEASAAPSAVVSAPIEAGPPPLVAFRMLSDHFVEADEDAGRILPLAETVFRVEIAGWSSPDVKLPCTHPNLVTTPRLTKPRLVGAVTCFISAMSSYLAVVEKSPTELAVTTWQEEESSDPVEPRDLATMTVVAKIPRNPRWAGSVVMVDLTGHEVLP